MAISVPVTIETSSVERIVRREARKLRRSIHIEWGLAIAAAFVAGFAACTICGLLLIMAAPAR